MPADDISSDVEIVNAALQKLGLESINDFDTDDAKARLAKATYAQIRDDLLRQHRWNFAIKRASLAATTLPTGVWDYTYAMSLPSDCLRILELEDEGVEKDETNWEVEGAYILTNLTPPCKVKYIYRNVDVQSYDPNFIDVLIERLMSEWVEPLVKATNLAEWKAKVYTDKLRLGRSMDGKEATPKELESSTYINSRW